MAVAPAAPELAALRKALPAHVFTAAPARSLAYVLRDIVVVAALAAAQAALERYVRVHVRWSTTGCRRLSACSAAVSALPSSSSSSSADDIYISWVYASCVF